VEKGSLDLLDFVRSRSHWRDHLYIRHRRPQWGIHLGFDDPTAGNAYPCRGCLFRIAREEGFHSDYSPGDPHHSRTPTGNLSI